MKQLLTLVLAAVMLCSCTAAEPDMPAAETEVRNYVSTHIKETWSNLEEYMVDISEPEIVLERTTQLLMVEIQSVDSLTFTGSCHFGYTGKIRKIYHDSSESLKTGDCIPLRSTEGVMKAADAAELVKYPLTFKGQKILTGTYTDNDYILSSQWNAVPMEVGGTYIVYLSSETLQREGYYTECGYSLLYETVGDMIYTGTDRILSEKTLTDVEKEIENQLASRKGRVDELGYSLYSYELHEIAAGEEPLTYPMAPSRILSVTKPDDTDLVFWKQKAREIIARTAESIPNNKAMGDLSGWAEITNLTGYPLHSYDTGRICAVAFDFLDKNGNPGWIILDTEGLHAKTVARGKSLYQQFHDAGLADSPLIDVTGEPYFFYAVFSEGYGILKDDGTLDIFNLYSLLKGSLDEDDIVRNWILPGKTE